MQAACLDPAAPARPADASWREAVNLPSLAVPFVARVVANLDGGPCQVRMGNVVHDADCAASCLVPPRPGDQVACWRVAQDDGDAVFVVAVLTRADAGAALQVRLADGVSLSGHAGSLAIEARDAVRLDSPTCRLQADSFEMRVDKASLVYRSLQSIGEVAAATVGQIRLVGAMLSTVFDRQIHHAQQRQTSVDGVDRTDAQVIQQCAGSLLHLQGENLLANGDRVVKMQGTQIHLG